MLTDQPYLIELLTPRQDVKDLEGSLERFRRKFRRISDLDAGVSIPDNPLGTLHFTALEVLSYLELPVEPERLILHLNTFHRKGDLDDFLGEAHRRGVRYLLCVSGDGHPQTSRLEPEDLGTGGKVVTSVELIAYIRREYGDAFALGGAFNPYEPFEHEGEKLRRKIEAGAEFVITQPVLGRDKHIDRLSDLQIPVYIGAWMSRNTDLLYACVGREKEENAERYDPKENLRLLEQIYPRYGIYLSLLSSREDWRELLRKEPCPKRWKVGTFERLNVEQTMDDGLGSGVYRRPKQVPRDPYSFPLKDFS